MAQPRALLPRTPDLIRVASGRMFLIYSDTDGHFSRENQVLTLLASDDGRTWCKHREVDRRDVRQGGDRFITPRLSGLSDGRLAVLVDQDNHFHEDQPPGNLIYWSRDGGDAWEGRHVRLSHRRGLAEVAVDGKTLLYHTRKESKRRDQAEVGRTSAR